MFNLTFGLFILSYVVLCLLVMSLNNKTKQFYASAIVLSFVFMSFAGYQYIPIFQKTFEYKQFQLKDHYFISGVVTATKTTTYQCKNGEIPRTGCHNYNIINKKDSTFYVYDKPTERDWIIISNIGNVTLDRIDKYGYGEPPLFQSTHRGDVVYSTINFDNYNLVSDKYSGKNIPTIPDYPELESGFIMTPVLDMTNSRLAKQWNDDVRSFMSEAASEYYRLKFNPIIVITYNKDPKYVGLLLNKWKGVKLNDVVIVFSLTGKNINWIKPITYQDNVNTLMYTKLSEYEAAHGQAYDIIPYLNIVSKFYNEPTTQYLNNLKTNINPNHNYMTWYFVLTVILGSILVLIYSVVWDYISKKFKQ